MSTERPHYLEQLYRYRVELMFALEAAQTYIAKTIITETDDDNRNTRPAIEWFMFRKLCEVVSKAYAEMTTMLTHNVPPNADQLYLKDELFRSMDLCKIHEYTGHGKQWETRDGINVPIIHCPELGSIHPTFEELEKKLKEGKRWTLKFPD